MIISICRFLRKLYHVFLGRISPRGSIHWLIGTEIKYGGFVSNVRRNVVSKHDHRTKEQIESGGMTGGDRMLCHRYAAKYAEYLKPFISDGKAKTVVEVGILKGTGLAIWCDLFGGARVIGLDIDLGHTQGNMNRLRSLGAFRNADPELYEFDQFDDNSKLLSGILHGDKIDVCIDDGLHSDQSIISTIQSVLPYMANDFVYFIEDNDQIHAKISLMFPKFEVESIGELTIIRNRKE